MSRSDKRRLVTFEERRELAAELRSKADDGELDCDLMFAAANALSPVDCKHEWWVARATKIGGGWVTSQLDDHSVPEERVFCADCGITADEVTP